MTYFYSKFYRLYKRSAKAALLSASALYVSACVTSYAGATNAALIQPVALPIMDRASPQITGLISAQTSVLTPQRVHEQFEGQFEEKFDGQSETQSLNIFVSSPNAVPQSAEAATISLTATKAVASPPEIQTIVSKNAVVKMAEAQTAKSMDAEQMDTGQMDTGQMDTGQMDAGPMRIETMEKTEMKPENLKPENLKSEKTMTNSAPQMKSPMNVLLGHYVKAPDAMGVARFDYAGLKASQSDQIVLADYIKTLEAKDPNTLSAAEATAYWANLYNAVTIKVIMDNYPVKSIKEIRSGAFSAGPWKKKLTTVNGNPMTLDDIEHETLRKKYPSPLIHYMVNCASIGCPNLKNSLWEARTLDADREAAARIFINSSRGAKVTSKGLVVSSIYDWFQEDFGGSKDGVLKHLSHYATGDLKAAIEGGAKIKSFDYDWALNE